MATKEVDSDLEEGELSKEEGELPDSDSCDDGKFATARSKQSKVKLSKKVIDKRDTGGQGHKGRSSEKLQTDSRKKTRDKEFTKTGSKSSLSEHKSASNSSKRKRSSDYENEKHSKREDSSQKGVVNESTAKKDAFDIVREKNKSVPDENEPPVKIQKTEERNVDIIPFTSDSFPKDDLNPKTKSEARKENLQSNLVLKSTKKLGTEATFGLSNYKESNQCPYNCIEKGQGHYDKSKGEGQSSSNTNDLDEDIYDFEVSSQNGELDDTLKESDGATFDFDFKDVVESETTDQQFTENSSPTTHEFEIIDDLGVDDDGGESNLDDLSDEDLDDSEIYAWLEEGIDRKAMIGDGSADDGPIEREKVVLKEKGHDPFEVLPEGWVVVTHNSGMPVYLHKQSRVCTLSKPYFLGPGSVRKHDVPVSAVPCLHYSREIQKEKERGSRNGTESKNDSDGSDKNDSSQAGMTNGDHLEMKDGENSVVSLVNGDPCDEVEDTTRDQEDRCGIDVLSTRLNEDLKENNNEDTVTGDAGQLTDDNAQPGDKDQTGENGNNAPPVKIECAEQRKKENSLDPYEIRKYCERLFHFRTITVKKFKTWKDRRHHLNTQKRRSRPALPSNTKLITCSIPLEKGDDKAKRKEFVLNPTGKSYVCILHEYAQHTLRVQPRYVFRELENAQNPYSATVVINDVEYGTGYASSKKTAKMEAAKATLSILIPAMNQFIVDGKDNTEDYSFFDEIKIEDPRVSDLCNKAGQPSPYQILLECLKRNYGMGDTQCQIDVKSLKHQKSEYSLTVGKHTVTVVCKNKREGKQRAAQAMLQQLHPHITGLGSLLRLYGRSSWKSVKEKKKEEHSITELQSQARSNKPNTAVLDKLKEEMEKIQDQKDSIKSKGKMRVDSSVLPANVKSLDL